MALRRIGFSPKRERSPTTCMLFLLLLKLLVGVDGFLPQSQYYCQHSPPPQYQYQYQYPPRLPLSLNLAARYGPPVDDRGELQDLTNHNSDDDDDDENAHEKRRHQEQKAEFRHLLDRVLNATAAEHVPSLLTKHTELLLRMPGVVATEAVQEILDDYEKQGSEEEVERVTEAVDLVLSFAEDFVNQSKSMDDNHKQLLGRIIRTMTESNSNNNNNNQEVSLSESNREEQLDQLMATEKDQFTRGFLRYLDAECDRIARAPTISKESTRLRETLLVIKTRILEELGQDLGEGALVLGQLVAYDDRKERLAVLDAGLQVRGLDFAQELMGLTEEALEGFQAVPNGDVDPTLVSRVEEIDERVRAFVNDNGAFQ